MDKITFSPYGNSSRITANLLFSDLYQNSPIPTITSQYRTSPKSHDSVDLDRDLDELVGHFEIITKPDEHTEYDARQAIKKAFRSSIQAGDTLCIDQISISDGRLILVIKGINTGRRVTAALPAKYMDYSSGTKNITLCIKNGHEHLELEIGHATLKVKYEDRQRKIKETCEVIGGFILDDNVWFLNDYRKE